MAESLVGKIVSNAGKQWSRNTVADGNWLNSNTVQKFNENDKTLAEAIESVSAAMEHFTPEITPSAWPCAANKTIQNIEQNADGSLNVTYQPIESSSTSDESLWSLFYQNEYDDVLATYSEIEADINHEAGALSENLTIPAGIYDVKIEVLYKPTQGIINNKLDIAISPTTNIADALYQTFILFDDTLNVDDNQSQWITGIIDLTEGESTTLKFLIKGESAQGRYKLNHIYINSIGGAAGPAGPEGPQGPQGPTGPQGIGLSADSSVSEYGHYVDIWKQGASQYDTRFEVRDGLDGKSLSAEYVEDSEHRQTQVKIGQIDGVEQTSFNLPWGADGHTPEIEIDPTTKEWMIDDESTGVVAEGQDGANGISLSAKSSTVGNVHTVEIWQEGASTAQTSFNVLDGQDGVSGTSLAAYSSKDNKTTTVVIYDPVNDPTHQSPINTFTVLDGADGSGASYTFDSTTLSGTGATGDPIGVKTNVIATQDWVGGQGFLKNSDLTDYATKTYANEASAAALSQAQTWVGQQGYLTSIPNTYALKTDVEAASANALSEAESWVENKHYLTAVPDSYATKTYANEASANALSQAESWVQSEGYLKSVSSSGSIQGDGTTLSPLTLKTSAEQALASINGKIDKSQLEINANTNLIKYTNGNSSSAISAVNYRANLGNSTIVPQRLVVVTGDQEIIDHCSDYSENKYGTIFFVTSAHN